MYHHLTTTLPNGEPLLAGLLPPRGASPHPAVLPPAKQAPCQTPERTQTRLGEGHEEAKQSRHPEEGAGPAGGAGWAEG